MLKLKFKLILIDLFFIGILLLFGACYYYYDILRFPPDGVHVWRQSDCASMAYSYFKEGNGLFDTKMHNLLNGEGRAVGEFPLMYYIVGKLYSVFGYHIMIYRKVWMVITFSGLFFLFKFLSGVLKDKFWAGIISLFTFTSPIFIIYGISFLPEPISISFLFISAYSFYRYSLKGKLIPYYVGLLFVFLAATLKITTLIPFIAIAGTYLYSNKDRLFLLSFWKNIRSLILPIVLTLVLILSWMLYAKNYNFSNKTAYFFLKSAPIWKLTMYEISDVYTAVIGWTREYLSKIGIITLVVMATFNVLPIWNKGFDKKVDLFYKFSLIGFFSFVALFFSQFKAHDYYVVNMVFILPLTVGVFVIKLHSNVSFSREIKYVLLTFFFFITLFSFNHSVDRVKDRISKPSSFYNRDLLNFSKEIEKYGISRDDIIVIPQDKSPNIVLYALNMKGYTGYNLSWNRLENLKKRGAKWMLVQSKNQYNNPIYKGYENKIVAQYNEIRVFSLE